MRRRIVLVGQAYWANYLAGLVNEHVPGVRAVALNYSPRSNLRHVRSLPTADAIVRIGYRPGGTSRNARLFELAWRVAVATNRDAERVCYWIGSDVSKALLTPQRSREAARHFRHLAGAPWLSEELQGLGIAASTVVFPTRVPKLVSVPPMPSRPRVLSYIPDSRADYFSGPLLLEAASELQDVDFDIIGGHGTWAPNHPRNVRFHGWQQDVYQFYGASTVVLRLVRHDAIGSSVRDALFFGRHVAYTYALPHTTTIPYGDGPQLFRYLRDLVDMHAKGEWSVNTAGRNWALDAFNEERLTRNFTDAVLRNLPSGSH